MASEIIVAMPNGTPVVLPDGPINPKRFGAVGDGIADDTAAINAAIAAARARTTPNGGYGFTLARVVFDPGTYLVTGTINATGFQWGGLHIEAAGAVIYARVPGGVILDALGSRYMTLRDFSIFAEGNASTAAIGIQVGRTTNGVSADNHLFENVSIDGYYTSAAFLNVAAETSLYRRCVFGNRGASGFAAIFDGTNHWNVASAFTSVTLSTDTAQSFNDQTLITPIFYTPGGATPLWLCNNKGFRVVSGYIDTASTRCVYLYSETSGTAFRNLSFDMHCETNTITDVFLITGPGASVLIAGLAFQDHDCYASNSVFTQDAGVTGCTIENCDVNVPSFPNGTPHVFNGAGVSQSWGADGRVQIPSAANWHAFNGWTGSLIEGSTRSLVIGNGGFGMWAGQPVTSKPTITGAKSSNAALGSLITALASYGLITDSTTT